MDCLKIRLPIKSKISTAPRRHLYLNGTKKYRNLIIILIYNKVQIDFIMKQQNIDHEFHLQKETTFVVYLDYTKNC